jgi:hypothetical protein
VGSNPTLSATMQADEIALSRPTAWAPTAERWQSWLNAAVSKTVRPRSGSRGFESPPLRHLPHPFASRGRPTEQTPPAPRRFRRPAGCGIFPAHGGQLAQGESACFTRRKSLVQIQHCPPSPFCLATLMNSPRLRCINLIRVVVCPIGLGQRLRLAPPSRSLRPPGFMRSSFSTGGEQVGERIHRHRGSPRLCPAI